jgi:hypothetical protein
MWSTKEVGQGTTTFVDGLLICMDVKGNLFLVQPDPNAFIKIAELPKAHGKINGPVWTKPIVANGQLFLRFKQHLICYNIIDEQKSLAQFISLSDEKR